jgi:two-component system CitB family sensor kinase
VVTRREVERDGRPLGSVVTVLDRTEVERLTDELGAVRLMTQALRAQRHEFVNRLHTVHGLLHTGDADDAAEYVSALLDSPAVAWPTTARRSPPPPCAPTSAVRWPGPRSSACSC